MFIPTTRKVSSVPRAKKTAAPTEPSLTDPAVHAVAAASPTPVEGSTRYKRPTAKERKALLAEIKRTYKAGASITATAAHVGKSYGYVQRALADAGVKTRSRGGSKPKAK